MTIGTPNVPAPAAWTVVPSGADWVAAGAGAACGAAFFPWSPRNTRPAPMMNTETPMIVICVERFAAIGHSLHSRVVASLCRHRARAGCIAIECHFVRSLRALETALEDAA